MPKVGAYGADTTLLACRSWAAVSGLITDEGKIEIPLNLRGSGFWLTGLFGRSDDSVDESGGYIAFAGQPAANSTITLNSVTWTFVTGTPAASRRRSAPASTRR